MEFIFGQIWIDFGVWESAAVRFWVNLLYIAIFASSILANACRFAKGSSSWGRRGICCGLMNLSECPSWGVREKILTNLGLGYWDCGFPLWRLCVKARAWSWAERNLFLASNRASNLFLDGQPKKILDQFIFFAKI